jgi:hypothetical protein
MKQFKSAGDAQRFLSAHDQINNLFHFRRDVTAQSAERLEHRHFGFGRNRQSHQSEIIISAPPRDAHLFDLPSQVDAALLTSSVTSSVTPLVGGVALHAYSSGGRNDFQLEFGPRVCNF